MECRTLLEPALFTKVLLRSALRRPSGEPESQIPPSTAFPRSPWYTACRDRCQSARPALPQAAQPFTLAPSAIEQRDPAH